MPIGMMPKFVQIIANFNPLYHMNQLFIAVWNGQLEWNVDMLQIDRIYRPRHCDFLSSLTFLEIGSENLP